MNNRRRNLFYKNGFTLHFLNFFKKNEGFTLIELVVVFTVIAILSTIGTVSLVSYSRSQALNQATSDLVQALNTAKSLSGSQLKNLDKNGSGPIGCLDYQTLSGYGVQVSVTQKNYQLYMECVGNGVKTQNKPNEWKTPLPSNVFFDAATNNVTDVFFPVLSGGTLTTGSGNADSIVLKSNYNIPPKTISLKQGYISIQ
jgi:prepilin-type N-terminal cleavage/methylation domain-containing protein